MIHAAINGWFWDRPDTGSGQYVRRLVETFAALAPHVRITLIAPQGREVEAPPGIAVERVPLQGRGHLAKLRFEQQGFPQAAGRIGADVAHVPYWGGPLRSPVPVVVTIHDLIPLILPEYRGGMLARLYTGLVAAAARGAAAIITDSEASRADILQHLSLPPERVRAILLAAGQQYTPRGDDQAVRQKYDLPPDFALYLGGYDIRKNVQTLLKAYTYVRDGAGAEFPLVLAGRPPQKRSARFTDVERLINEMNIRDAVRAIGWVDEVDKPSLYRLATCFVYPSRYEGFGLPVLEAMACGTPVVTSSTSSLPEIVGDAAFMVAPNDARSIAGALLALFNQSDLARELGRRGLERAQMFSWARTAAQTLEVYEEAAASGR
jgi:glycosyltransferase involved in cell wall biosynthesis